MARYHSTTWRSANERITLSWRQLRPLAAALLLLGTCPRPALAQESDEILLLDPDANHQSLFLITSLFNRVLGQASVLLKLRPFQTVDSFRDVLDKPTSKFAIVSAQYLQTEHDARLKPAFVRALKGDVYYAKVMVASKAGATPKSLRSIALTAVGTQNALPAPLLAQLEHGGVNTQTAHVVRVSKDVDAVLAMAFGQVEAAYVTPNTLDVLKRINPALAAGVRVLFTGSKVVRAPLCVVTGHSTEAESQRLFALLSHLQADADGRQLMGLLDSDAWVRFEPRMLEP